jgi:hypothetical protein
MARREALRPQPAVPKVARPASRYVWSITPADVDGDSTSVRVWS